MKIVFLVYIIFQLLTNAYAYAVIESVKPLVVKELHSRGYVENKNSLYNFNYTFSNILKGLIPFYYLKKAFKIVKKNRNIEDQADELINKGKYILPDDKKEVIRTFGQDTDVLDKNNSLSFQTEKYIARKNDSLLKTYETPLDYTEIEPLNNEDNLNLTPFIDTSETHIERVILSAEELRKEVTKAICNLNNDDLEDLKKVINELQDYNKKNKKLKLEKNIA